MAANTSRDGVLGVKFERGSRLLAAACVAVCCGGVARGQVIWGETPPDAGQTLLTADVLRGPVPVEVILGALNGEEGSRDVDIYRVRIPDPANFLADTVTGFQTDLQLWLFDERGRGITHSDDQRQTFDPAITGRWVPGPGVYYIAVSAFDIDARNAAGLFIWRDDPADVERRPDGPGASDPVLASWAGGNVQPPELPYTMWMIGVRPALGECPADFNADGTADFFDYLDFVAAFADELAHADFNGDRGVDFFDYLDFVAAFDEGC